MRIVLLTLFGLVCPNNVPNEGTYYELLDKVNALTLKLDEIEKAQTKSNIHFFATISKNVYGYKRFYST